MANTKDFGSLDRGSIPLRATKMTFWIDNLEFLSPMVCENSRRIFTPLAQWIEQKISNLWVIGLNPIGSTTRIKMFS